MNDEACTQEKDFTSILNSFQKLGESRDKLICEIDDIIDRISENREPSVEPSDREARISPTTIVPTLYRKVREMDLANEKLRAIINRLNKLA